MDVGLMLKESKKLKAISEEMVLTASNAMRIAQNDGLTKYNYDDLLKNQNEIITSLSYCVTKTLLYIDELVKENNQLNHSLNIIIQGKEIKPNWN